MRLNSFQIRTPTIDLFRIDQPTGLRLGEYGVGAAGNGKVR
jgi:hypothetical protein